MLYAHINFFLTQHQLNYYIQETHLKDEKKKTLSSHINESHCFVDG